MTKKTFLIILAIIIVLATAMSIFILRTGSQGEEERNELPPPSSGRFPGLPAPPPPGGETSGEGEKEKFGERVLPVRPEEPLQQLTDFPVISPTLNAAGNRILFYKKDGGDLLSYDFDSGAEEKKSNITVIGLIDAIWSPKKDRAALLYLGNDSLKGFLHIGTSGVAVLAQNITSISWSPDGSSLSYTVKEDDRLKLVISDGMAKNQRMVFSTPLLDARASWIAPDRIAFETAPSSHAPGFLFQYLRSSNNFNRMLGPLYGLTSLFSPDGALSLVSFANGKKNPLVFSVRDGAGKEVFSPGFQTLPEKCVWTGAKEFLCAVPKILSPKDVWPDDYLRGEVNTSDRIILVDLEKKNSRIIFEEGNFDVANLAVTKDKKNLFFVNRIDGTLWRFRP
jgi:hypothetical protein